MEYSTRIDDLPENITMSVPIANQSMGNSPMESQYGGTMGPGDPMSGYKQLNVHPNPYGNGPPQSESIGMPMQTHTTKPSNNPYVSQSEQPAHLSHLPPHQLPSRDIPQDMSIYSQDEEISPNFVPQVKLTSEFVKEYEDRIRDKEKYATQVKRLNNTWEDWLADPDVRATIIITVLFWIFQLPILNLIVLKRLSIFGVYSLDGNLNTRGLVVKSLLFGSAYYVVAKLGEFIR